MTAAPQRVDVDRHDFLAQLLWVAARRRYKPGWVAHAFRSRFGAWPPKEPVEPREPTAEVRAFLIRQRAVYRRKRRAAAEPEIAPESTGPYRVSLKGWIGAALESHPDLPAIFRLLKHAHGATGRPFIFVPHAMARKPCIPEWSGSSWRRYENARVRLLELGIIRLVRASGGRDRPALYQLCAEPPKLRVAAKNTQRSVRAAAMTRRVAAVLGNGVSIREAAKILGVCTRTVQTHKKRAVALDLLANSSPSGCATQVGTNVREEASGGRLLLRGGPFFEPMEIDGGRVRPDGPPIIYLRPCPREGDADFGVPARGAIDWSPDLVFVIRPRKHAAPPPPIIQKAADRLRDRCRRRGPSG